MHIPTHILSGWCIANAFPQLSAKDRLLIVLAASLPDLDGLGLLWSAEAYQAVHHVWGHNLTAALALSLIASLCSDHKRWCFLLCLAAFHLHLLMDFYGSGPGWGIAYGWPFDEHSYQTDRAWSLGGWQNYVTLAGLLVWAWIILRTKRRTLFELFAPTIDRAFVNVFGRREGQEL